MKIYAVFLIFFASAAMAQVTPTPNTPLSPSPSETPIQEIPTILEKSLFMTPDELNIANGLIERYSPGGQFESTVLEQAQIAAPKSLTVHLSALFFMSDRDWKFWLNGKRYVSEHHDMALPEGFTLNNVTDKFVELRWTPGQKDSASYVIRLRPNQQFDTGTRQIYEGTPVSTHMAIPSIPIADKTSTSPQPISAIPDGQDPAVAAAIANHTATVNKAMEMMQQVRENYPGMVPAMPSAQPTP